MQSAPRESVASLYSVSPFWRNPKHKDLAELTLFKGEMPVYVGGNLALRLLYELEAGREPTFHYKDWADFQDDVYVSVSSVKFHQKVDTFKQCISDALPYGSDKVKDTAVYFSTAKHGLRKTQRLQLKEIILFAKVDKNMKIQLRGHSDGRGRRIYNKRLSNRRASSVKQYLISQGVAANQISQLSMGESSPSASNRSERGRRNNRRVDILIKHE